ncbi:uncharacterized protein LOC129318889 [Prosopis cineraria]|uniref:uncharacterized protein LOC129318889 n=1 Tax=Prosopis cineraria TaxID=364024 RepID=UPI0024103D7F|nr:uncharacterized protein LOC129318889 [Prosopis cineraria]
MILKDVPKMINNIWAKKCHLGLPSLQSINLDGQEFNGRSFLNLMAYLQGIRLNVKAPEDVMKIIKDMQKLTYLKVSNSNIEDVLNLEAEIEGPVTLSLERMILKNLSELRHIWKGPKYILSLHNLSELIIEECKKLRAIFSVSILKSLPQLSSVTIEGRDELVDIIEESAENHLHQPCFRKLERIVIKRCNRLKYLFSLSTPSMFPKLWKLEIEEASKLEQVFMRKQNDTENMVLKDVFPDLWIIRLKSLPMLAAICSGISFQTAPYLEVVDCPKYQEITAQLQEGHSNLESKNQAKTEEQLYVNSENAQVVPYMGETSGSSSNLAKIKEETLMEVQAKDPTLSLEKHATETLAAESQLRRTSVHEFDDEREISNSTMQLQHKDLAEIKSTIKASHKTSIPFDDYSMDHVIKERVQEGPTPEDVVVAIMIAELAARKSSSELITPLQEELSSSAKHNVAESFRQDTSIKKTRMVATSVPDEETKKDISRVIDPAPASKLLATTSSSFQVANMKEAHEQDFEDNVETEEAMMAIQSTDLESVKKFIGSSMTAQSSETGKEAVGVVLTSGLSVATTSSNLERRIESIPEETTPIKDKIDAFSISSQAEGSPSSLPAISAKETATGIDTTIAATETSPTATPIESEFIKTHQTIKEVRGSIVQVESESEKLEKTNPPEVIPSVDQQSQVANAGTSPKLGVCEIFQLVELKHSETALLAQALEQYPQLLLPHEHRSHRMMLGPTEFWLIFWLC